MTRLLGISDEQRLEIEQATGIKTEGIRLLFEATQQQIEQATKQLETATREVTGIIGPHGAVTRLQAGGLKISPGTGISVYDGILKTTIKPNGDLAVGSGIEDPRGTSLYVFVEEQTYNNEVMGAGDALFGDNTESVSNVKFDASTGQLQFRYGQIVKAYMDTDGSIKAGEGVVIQNEDGISILVTESETLDTNAYKFVGSDGTVYSGMYGYITTIAEVVQNTYLYLTAKNAPDAQVMLDAQGTDTGQVILRAVGNGTHTATIDATTNGTTGEIVLNQDGDDINTRIEGDTDTSLFIADAGLDAIGIGGAAESGYKVKVTGKIKATDTIERLSENIDTGWIPKSETWTRTGNHTFTLSGNYSADPDYQPGIKVRYKDGGSNEYGVIYTCSHSAGTTTVNLIPNNDYAMAAATITDRYISKIGKPDGFPATFNFTTTVTSSSGTLTTVTVVQAVFTPMTGTIIKIDVAVSLVDIGTGTGTLRFTTPVTSNRIYFGFGREYATTGNMLQVVWSSGAALASIVTYNNGSVITNGYSTGISIIGGY